jgi:hypothetical protein
MIYLKKKKQIVDVYFMEHFHKVIPCIYVSKSITQQIDDMFENLACDL